MSGKRARARRKAEVARCAAAEAVIREAETATRVAAIMAEIQERYYADLRRDLAEAAARHRAQQELADAFAVTDEFTWKPWGYILDENDGTAELPLVVPTVPQLRLIHSRPQPPARARQQLAERAHRELVAA